MRRILAESVLTFVLVAGVLAAFTGCGPEDWCKAEQRAHAIASTVLPALSAIDPAKASILSASLDTAHAGVLAVGCDGDKATLGQRVTAVADVVGQVLAVYGSVRSRDIGPPPLTETERLQALLDLEKLKSSIAREVER